MIRFQDLSGSQLRLKLTLLGKIVRRESACETSNGADESWLSASLLIGSQFDPLVNTRGCHYQS